MHSPPPPAGDLVQVYCRVTEITCDQLLQVKGDFHAFQEGLSSIGFPYTWCLMCLTPDHKILTEVTTNGVTHQWEVHDPSVSRRTAFTKLKSSNATEDIIKSMATFTQTINYAHGWAKLQIFAR